MGVKYGRLPGKTGVLTQVCLRSESSALLTHSSQQRMAKGHLNSSRTFSMTTRGNEIIPLIPRLMNINSMI